MDIRILRSHRRSISLEVTPRGLLVRAPMGMPDADIDAFLAAKRDWIARHTPGTAQTLSREELEQLAN